jgi:hypothetical protein
MAMNVLHMRFAAIAGGILLLGFFLLSGGSFGSPEVIQIDFGMYPEVFEGAEVEIDGKVVGTLERTGQATRAGFKVKEGKHVVRVLHAELGSQEMQVEVRSGEKVRVMLDMVEHYDARTRTGATVIGARF